MVATSSSATLIHRHSTTGRDIDQHPTRKWSIVDSIAVQCVLQAVVITDQQLITKDFNCSQRQ